MDDPVHHLAIEIFENSLDDDHDHENDHQTVVSLYGYVTGNLFQMKVYYYNNLNINLASIHT